jgi:hypothetical protein
LMPSSLEALCINVRSQMETEFQDLNTFPNSVWEREAIWGAKKRGYRKPTFNQTLLEVQISVYSCPLVVESFASFRVFSR